MAYKITFGGREEIVKRDPHSKFYIIAFITGIIVLFLGIFFFKALIWLVGFSFRHWILITLSILGLLFVKKLLFRKKKK